MKLSQPKKLSRPSLIVNNWVYLRECFLRGLFPLVYFHGLIPYSFSLDPLLVVAAKFQCVISFHEMSDLFCLHPQISSAFFATPRISRYSVGYFCNT